MNLTFITRIPLVPAIAAKFWKLYHVIIFQRVEDQVRQITNNKIVTGPFKGMTYPRMSRGNIHASTTPKLLGLYEKELYPSLESMVCNEKYDRIIVIGAADGFYAVGLAIRVPSARVIAFEADVKLRGDLAMVAECNGVADRIDIRGFCDPASLQSIGRSERNLIICDCEGGELDLIREEILRGLGQTDLIVECHDMIVPNCTSLIREQLTVSHSVSAVVSAERTLSDIPTDILAKITGRTDEIEFAVREHRHYTMTWLIATQIHS